MNAKERRSAHAIALSTIIFLGCGGPQLSAAASDPNATEEATRADAKSNWGQPDIEPGLSSLGPALIDCYKTAVSLNRKEHGSVMIWASIAPNGHVERAMEEVSMSKGLAQCLAGVVAAATFRSPGADKVYVKIPLTFEQQRDEAGH